MRLDGKTVLITRAPHQAGELRALFEARGAGTVLFPTIEILPPADWNACDRAIDGAYMYDGILFSSSNGVEGLLGRMKERGIAPGDLRTKKIYIVGEATGRTLASYGLEATAMPEKFTGADLAGVVSREDLHGLSFLFPTGDLTSSALADTVKLLGGHVETVIVYRTVSPETGPVRDLLQRIREGGIDIVTFTSPSTVKNFRRLFTAGETTEIRDRVVVAVIGPTTAAAAGNAGLPPDVIAPRSTAADLVDAVCAHAGKP